MSVALSLGVSLAATSLSADSDNFRVTVHTGPAITTPSQVTLFAFDDQSIPATNNLKLEMSVPQKHQNNPILSRGDHEAVDHIRASGPAVIREGNQWRMWYQAWSPSGSHVAYAESDDGIHWTKPHLNLKEFQGNRDNNLVAIEPGVEVRSIIRDEQAPPDQRYIMLAIDRSWWKGWRADRPSMTRIEVSPDGFHWSPLRDTPGILYAQNKALSIYRFNHNYHIGGYQVAPFVFQPGQSPELGQSFPAPRTFSVWRSSELTNWPLERTVAFRKAIRSSSSPYQREWDREEVHMGAMVTSYHNVCLAIYGQWHHPINEGAPEYHGEKVSVDLGFLVSNDGLHFREPAPGYSLIKRDQELSWDPDFKTNDQADNLLLIQGPIINTEDQTFIYYSASSPGGNVAGLKMNIGMASLPRDRFGALTPIDDSQMASLLSCPLEISGLAKLAVNADIPPGARLKVSLIDEAGSHVLADYTAEQSVLISGHMTSVIHWDKQRALPTGRTFRVRAELLGKGIKLYALYISSLEE